MHLSDIATARLQSWLTECCLVEQNDDLHIDQIDPALGDRRDWLMGGGLIMAEAVTFVAGRSCKLALVYSLQLNMIDSFDIRALTVSADGFDTSPPSIFVSPVGREPWLTCLASEQIVSRHVPADQIRFLWPEYTFSSGLLMLYTKNSHSDPVATLWIFP